MIMYNNKKVLDVYKGTTRMAKMYKGTDLVYDKLLPNEYLQLDYIETDGACWIEIPVVPDANTEFEATASNIITQACQLMVTQASKTNNYFVMGKATATQKIMGRVGNTYVTSTIDGIDKFTAKLSRSSFYVNGTKIGDFSSQTITGLGNVDIFRGNYAGSIYYTGAGTRVHEAIIRKNGTEVFHGIPAENSSHVLGLYDLISHTFLTNKGTGTLISGLPLEYTKIDWMKNSSSTRIKTTITPAVDDIEIELRCKAVTESWYMFQSRASSSATAFGISGAKSGASISFSWGTNTAISDITRTAGHILTLKATAKNGSKTLYVKDETSGTEDTKTNTYTIASYPSSPFYLWGNYSQYVSANANVYYLRFKVGGNVVLEYLPAMKNNVAGFYNRITRNFITTPTAGSMTGGNDS